MLENTIKYIDYCNKLGKVSYNYQERFSESCNFYYFTNENIKGYFDKLDFSKDQSALTVCGSGDHIFNLLNKGVKEIDVFDTNKLAEYFALGIKKAALLTFSYNEFISFFEKMLVVNSKEEFELYNQISINIDEPYKSFWDKLFLYNMNNKLPLLSVLGMNAPYMQYITTINPYLSNETEYNKTQANLKQSNIKFIQVDIFSLNEKFNKLYDKIILSNILDYVYSKLGMGWNFKDIEPYIINSFNKLLVQDGKLILAYIFKYASFNNNVVKSRPISSSSLTQHELQNFEIMKFPSAKNELNDGIIISKSQK